MKFSKYVFILLCISMFVLSGCFRFTTPAVNDSVYSGSGENVTIILDRQTLQLLEQNIDHIYGSADFCTDIDSSESVETNSTKPPLEPETYVGCDNDFSNRPLKYAGPESTLTRYQNYVTEDEVMYHPDALVVLSEAVKTKISEINAPANLCARFVQDYREEERMDAWAIPSTLDTQGCSQIVGGDGVVFAVGDIIFLGSSASSWWPGGDNFKRKDPKTGWACYITHVAVIVGHTQDEKLPLMAHKFGARTLVEPVNHFVGTTTWRNIQGYRC